MSNDAPRVSGEAIVYRLFDVGYEIRLDRAAELLASNLPQRPKPIRSEAHTLQIPNPPVSVTLGTESLSFEGGARTAEVSARLFDFGVVSLRARIRLPDRTPWDDFARFAAALGANPPPAWFDAIRERLLARIRDAIVRPGLASVVEEYTVLRLHRLEDAAGAPFPPERLEDRAIAQLLLGEHRPLSATAQKEMLSPRLSYFDDDLVVLTWSSALVVEPVEEDFDVQYVIEFANAQLLELRYYDSLLDRELPKLYEEVAAARRAFRLLGRRLGRLLGTLQTRVADATESVERVENALKVVDDVFLGRIYSTALEIFRGPVWRRGIDRKMEILRDTYEMLNAEAQSLRAEVMELAIIALILLEIVLAFARA